MDEPGMTDRPVVSVVVPTYNRAGSVVRAIESVLRQTYTRVEVIVVDDGATDNTAQSVGAVQCRDPRVQYHRNAMDKGCAGARNTGLARAVGEYVAFLDDDDEYLPDKVLRQVQAFAARAEVDVVVSGVPACWCEGPAVRNWVELEFRPARLFESCSVMCRKRVFKDVRFRCRYMEWRDLAFQVYHAGYRVFLASEGLVLKNDVPGSLSKDREAMFVSALDNAKEYCRSTGGKPEDAVFRHYLANCEKTCGNYSLKRGRLWSAVRHYAAAFRAERRLRNLVPFA